MIFHIGIFFWLLLSTFFGAKKNKENKIYRYNYYLIIVIICIYSFLRWERGTDWVPYYNNFVDNNSFYDYMTAWHFEKGFQLLNYFVKILNGNYTIFLMIQALIIQILFSITIYKNIENPIAGVFLLYCFSLGNIYFVRSTLALSIVFFSIKYIKSNEKIKFLLIILIASTIHITALFFIPAIYIYRLKLSKILYGILLVVTVLLGILYLKNLVKIIFEIISPHRLIYLDENINILKILIGTIAPRLVFLIYFLLFIDFSKKSNEELVGYFNIYYFGVILSILLSFINPSLLRLSNMFEVFNLLIFPQIFILKKQKIILMLIFLIYFSLKFYSVLFGEYRELYIPLKTILNKEMKVEIF